MADETLTTKFPKIAAGQKYNRLLAIKFVLVDRHRMAHWKFRCDCGNEITASANSVRSGNSKSCGCSRTEAKIKHGKAGSPIYVTWRNVLRRCYDEKSRNYKYYGARGITVCDRWKTFEHFSKDMGERPQSGYSIDRIDVNGNYEPSNCRWATTKEQSLNKRPRSSHVVVLPSSGGNGV